MARVSNKQVSIRSAGLIQTMGKATATLEVRQTPPLDRHLSVEAEIPSTMGDKTVPMFL